ncbi:DUF2971 domain-containing protein [Treponema endosymbiont of Eucomonympha sp.]|uniref:DUF2971 domain-containing protein n=1 Tax=Treponema endosymbiont of Eucomonympha sp. TaxID=1580831 RepID=UPI00164FCFD5|nr:DUF2971 domain-containing protein [Treponema endosymbiont of Eucomonympha sp.]
MKKKNLGNQRLPLFEINYSPDRPLPVNFDSYKYGNNLHKFIADTLSTKNPAWAYEKEVRVITAQTLIKKNPPFIKPGDVKEVIFGIKTDDKVIEDTIKQIDTELQIKFYKIKSIPGTYNLEKIPLKI